MNKKLILFLLLIILILQLCCCKSEHRSDIQRETVYESDSTYTDVIYDDSMVIKIGNTISGNDTLISNFSALLLVQTGLRQSALGISSIIREDRSCSVASFHIYNTRYVDKIGEDIFRGQITTDMFGDMVFKNIHSFPEEYNDIWMEMQKHVSAINCSKNDSLESLVFYQNCIKSLNRIVN